MAGSEPAQDYTHADPVTDAALEWLLRLRNDSDANTSAQFEAWLRQDPRHAVEFRALQTLWEGPEFRGAVRSLPANLPAELAPRSRHWRRAAAVALVVVLGAAALHTGDFLLELRADARTDIGEMREVTLPDGSLMTLNSDSAVALDFDGGRRAVTLLRGEAYFDVTHDPAHPFHVKGGFGGAEVKGTAFSFRREADRDEIVLQRGRLEVGCDCADPARLTLLPEQAATIPSWYRPGRRDGQRGKARLAGGAGGFQGNRCGNAGRRTGPLLARTYHSLAGGPAGHADQRQLSAGRHSRRAGKRGGRDRGGHDQPAGRYPNSKIKSRKFFRLLPALASSM